jgi:hypothetical protein
VVRKGDEKPVARLALGSRATCAPEDHDPEVGDITYYAPWGNLAIFYRDFDHSRGLVKLSSIDSRIHELAATSGDFSVTRVTQSRPLPSGAIGLTLPPKRLCVRGTEKQ